VLGVGAEDAVRVEVGEDPLAELAQLARTELRTGGDQLPFRLSDLFNGHRARQLLHHPGDLARLLIRQRTLPDRVGDRRQDSRQRLTRHRHPSPQITSGRHPPRGGLR
jgi:hypothetical protein